MGAERGCGSVQAPCSLRISAKSSLPKPISLSDFSSWTEKILSSSSTSSSPSSFAPELPSDLPPLAAVSRMALPAEKTVLSAPPLANGGPFSIPDGCLDCEDGDDIIGDELDELLDSVSDPGEGGMVSPLALQNTAEGEGLPCPPVLLTSSPGSSVWFFPLGKGRLELHFCTARVVICPAGFS